MTVRPASTLWMCLMAGCLHASETGATDGSGPAAPAPKAAGAEPVLEYLWYATQAGFTEDKLSVLATEWNRRVDGGDYEVITANILKPEFETTDFDLVWVLLWPSQAARDAGWSQWKRDHAEAWRAATKGILEHPPKQHFAFLPRWGYSSPELTLRAGDDFFSGFNFCRYHSGLDSEALPAFQQEYNDWISGKAAVDYGYLILEPRFEMGTADFVWLDIFGSVEARETVSGSRRDDATGSPWNVMAACEEYRFEGMKIRS